MCNVTKHIISDMIWPNLRTNLCVYLDSNLAPRGKRTNFQVLKQQLSTYRVLFQQTL